MKFTLTKRFFKLHLSIIVSLIFFGVFLIFPVVYVIIKAFYINHHFNPLFFINILLNPVIKESCINSLFLAILSSLLAVIIGTPCAVFMTRTTIPGKDIFSVLLLLPFILPPFVGAIGIKQILARFGSLNLLLMKLGIINEPIDWLGTKKILGIAIVESLHLFPVVYLNVAASLNNIDPSLEEAAEGLGSSTCRKFLKITMPLATNGVFAGFIICFIGSFTDLGTPLIFAFRRLLPVLIYERITDIDTNPEGFALVLLVLTVTSFMFIIGKYLINKNIKYDTGHGQRKFYQKKSSVLLKCIAIGYILTIVLLSALPHIGVIMLAFQKKWFMSVLPESYTLDHFKKALVHPLTLSSIKNSILLSIGSTLLVACLGTALAYRITRDKGIIKNFMDILAMLPLAVPGLVIAFSYISIFHNTIFDPRTNPVFLLIIAYAVRRFPYMLRAASAGISQFPQAFEEAAAGLGSSHIKILRKITIPIIGQSLLAGSIMVFAFSMLEVSDSLILAMKEQFFPLAKAIYQLTGRIEDGIYIASALGVWSMTFLMISFSITIVTLGKKTGNIFKI